MSYITLYPTPGRNAEHKQVWWEKAIPTLTEVIEAGKREFPGTPLNQLTVMGYKGGQVSLGWKSP